MRIEFGPCAAWWIEQGLAFKVDSFGRWTLEDDNICIVSDALADSDAECNTRGLERPALAALEMLREEAIEVECEARRDVAHYEAVIERLVPDK